MPTATKTAVRHAETNNRTWTVRDKFLEAQRALDEAFVERQEEGWLLLVGIVAKKNVLFVGEPGIAKSAVQDGLLEWFNGPKFSILMHRNVTVEDLFGNISLKQLQETDTWRRNMTGRMPLAKLIVTDEVFKSSSISQTPQLKLMNEGTYEDGGHWVKSDITSFFSASNEWPKDDDTGIDGHAFFDRYAIRKQVVGIQTQAGLEKLLDITYEDDPIDRQPANIGKPVYRVQADSADLDQAHAEAQAIRWTREAGQVLVQIFDELKAAPYGILVSDRRKRTAVGLCQAAAWLDGATHVQPEHLAILAHVLWDDPREQPEKVAKLVARLANPVKWAVHEHTRELEVIEDQIDYDSAGSVDGAMTKLADLSSKLGVLKSTQEVRDLMAEVATTRSRILTKKARRGFRN